MIIPKTRSYPSGLRSARTAGDMKAHDLLFVNMTKAANYAIELFRAELRSQGHRSSGRLEESFSKVITTTIGGVAKGEIQAEDYGLALDKGVPAENVRYNPKVLLPWIRRIKPGLSQNEQKSFAYAIREKHRKEGIPTRGSYAYTSNGRRKGWIENGIRNGENDINEIINLAAFLDLLVSEELEKFTGTLNNG